MPARCPSCGALKAQDIEVPSQHFTKNLAPLLSGQRKELKATLVHLWQDIADVELNISLLEEAVHSLIRKRDLLTNYAEIHAPLLQPVMRCPPEVLSEIFLWEARSVDWQSEMQEYRQAVILPGQVCMQWRQVAFSTAELWARLSCRLKSEEGGNNLVSMVQAWLKRSNLSPLALYFRLSGHPWGRSHPVIELAMQHSQRWKWVRFEISLPMARSLEIVRGRVPMLEVLDLQGGFRGLDQGHAPLAAFKVAPMLHTVKIRTGISMSNILVPWIQLTNLSMGHGDRNAIIHALSLCLNLLSFEASFEKQLDTRETLHSPVVHPHLLTFQLYSDLSPSPVLDQITLPNLTHFDYIHDFGEEDGAASQSALFALSSLLKRSNCVLQRLCLDFHKMDLHDTELIACLSLTPGLIELELPFPCSAASMTPASLQYLTFDPNSSQKALLPLLQVLHLDYHPNIDLEILLNMIQSRRSGIMETPDNRTQELLRVELVGEITEQLVKRQFMWRVYEMRDAGLEVFTTDGWHNRQVLPF